MLWEYISKYFESFRSSFPQVSALLCSRCKALPEIEDGFLIGLNPGLRFLVEYPLVSIVMKLRRSIRTGGGGRLASPLSGGYDLPGFRIPLANQFPDGTWLLQILVPVAFRLIDIHLTNQVRSYQDILT